MKVRILVGALIASLLLNIAGLVFFICFLSLRGHYKAVKRENRQMAHNLSVVRGAGAMMDAIASDRVVRREFVSHFDGRPDTYALMPPRLQEPLKDMTLVVYLHGMGSNYLEPFMFTSGITLGDAVVASRPNTILISLSYKGTASWGNDGAISDISQNIRQVLQEYPISSVVLMGTSMGGCTVLSYAVKAPDDIKQLLAGIVSVESAGDLAELYRRTRQMEIRPALISALGGTPESAPALYKERSFLPHLEALPPQVRVAVISAKGDHIVPASLQKDIVRALEQRQQPVKLIEVDAGHGMPPIPIYLEALDFAISK